jgi:hypothetical protein
MAEEALALYEQEQARARRNIDRHQQAAGKRIDNWLQYAEKWRLWFADLMSR